MDTVRSLHKKAGELLAPRLRNNPLQPAQKLKRKPIIGSYVDVYR